MDRLVRLQKVLAHAGLASRRAAETLIEEGRVTVNGATITELGTRVDPERDAIKVDGKRVPLAPPPVYVLLHKPRGYVTTLSDPEGRPTVRDLLPLSRPRMYPVGRLDFASEGLLLFTNDGDLARDLMHPSSAVPKVYWAKVHGIPSDEALTRMARGVMVEGRRTLPARVRRLASTTGPNVWIEVRVVEGRKHQVRNMFMAVGHRVQRLKRVSYGGVEMGDLPPGRVRNLEPGEVERLRRAVRRRPPGPRNPMKKGTIP